MNPHVAVTVVKQSIVVEAPIARAFKVFTEEFGSFKPPEHNMLGVEIAETVFEPRVGGHIYDRGTDGSECRWARVLAYEPPNRVLLSWDISPRWQIETDPEKASGRYGSLPRRRTGPASSSSTASWSAMAAAGKACATVSAVIRAGHCICSAMPIFSPTRPDRRTFDRLDRGSYLP